MRPARFNARRLLWEKENRTLLFEQVTDKVVPLTRAIYNQMPYQLQKMTLMDKVVVITGYDVSSFLNLSH